MTITITTTTRRIRLLGVATIGVVALTAGLGACGSTAADDQASDTTNPAVLASIDPATADTVVVVEGGATSTGSSGGSDSSSSDQSAPRPVIDSFRTPEDIDCHNGDLQNFTASWSTSHATRVTISIDGPGVYAEYPADGDANLPFTCSSSHTFLLTAYGSSGTTTTQSITLQPRNAQAEPTDEDEENVGLPTGSTAKIEGGSTGQGSATDAQCNEIAGALDDLYEVAVNEPNGEAALATVDVAGAIQAGAEAVGCFFVGVE